MIADIWLRVVLISCSSDSVFTFISIQSDSVPALQIYLEILSPVVPLFSVFAENGLIASLIQRHNEETVEMKGAIRRRLCNK